MKILFCTNAFENVTNGPAKFANILANSNIKDFEIRILTEDVEKSILEKVYKLDIRLSKVLQPLSQFYRMYKYHIEAMRIRKNFDFDVLVYNNAFIGLLSSYLFKPTVGMINDYSNATVSITSVLNKKEKLTKRLVFHYFEKLYCKRRKSNIIVNSNNLKKQLIKFYGCNNDNIFVLHKAIEEEFVNRINEIEIVKKIKKSILFVKTDFNLGGLFDLIEAVKNYPDNSVLLTIVGPTEINHQGIIDTLEKGNIKYLLNGQLPQSEVYKLMETHEIFCVPSHKEAFGVANLEAIAHGCKIVSTNVGGIPEAMGSLNGVILVNPSKPVELLNAIEKSFNYNIEEYKNQIMTHLNEFSEKKVLNNFKKILNKINETNNTRP